MSRPGTPSYNQPIESFWKTIVDYIELYYNSERLHSGIGHYIPNHFSLFYLSTNLDKFHTENRTRKGAVFCMGMNMVE